MRFVLIIILLLLPSCLSVPYGEIRKAVKAVEEAKEYCKVNPCPTERVWSAWEADEV